ncbi:cytochrome c biogenesis CcdA family protein [Candidatus Poriferisodalis sp.]|uniref:cytochrome c biogenesis CcdA family protein n=1 Tax=Candidatus Poriferisodalis sp. TaxID=3101277 RepID=UPI003B0250AE
MNSARLSFAFTAGIVATVNPCGFAMLPAYLSFFLGIDRRASEGSRQVGIGRALATGAVVTAGIVVVFGIVGIALSAGLSALRSYVPWVAIAIGAGLVALGASMLAGFRLTAFLPKFERGPSGRDLGSLFAFGVSYAVASVSCGLATFLVVVTASAGDDSFVGSVVSFVLYALGMGMALTSLAVSLALARGWLLSRLRLLMRHTDTIAAVLLIAAGAFTIWYWLVDLTDRGSDGLVMTVERWSGSVSNWVASVGGVRLGLAMSIVLAVGAMVMLATGRRPTAPANHADGGPAPSHSPASRRQPSEGQTPNEPLRSCRTDAD